jgi:hypothetical protein
MKIETACDVVEFADNSRQAKSYSLVGRECIDASHRTGICPHHFVAGPEQ